MAAFLAINGKLAGKSVKMTCCACKKCDTNRPTAPVPDPSSKTVFSLQLKEGEQEDDDDDDDADDVFIDDADDSDAENDDCCCMLSIIKPG